MQNRLKAYKKRTSMLLASVMVVGGSLSGLGLPQTASAKPDNSQVVISQVYGGGGNSGAPYKSDFIELYNPTNEPISLDGMKLYYASASGAWPSNGDNIMTLQGTIGAGQYYLTKQADGSNAAPDLPTPDATGKLALSGTSGKVKLTDSGNNTLDLVGYGSPNEQEGAAPVAVLSNTTAAIRLELSGGGRGLDTDVNGTDFRVAAPDPRNSAYGNTIQSVTAQPGAGKVAAGSTVTLGTATDGATIHYRINAASDADPYLTYSGPITINSASQIQAYASKAGLPDSAVSTFNYTISSLSTIAEVRAMNVDEGALLEGVVTYKEVAGGLVNLYIQDNTAGIVVRGPEHGAVIGDRIQATGTYKPYNDLAQLIVTAGGVTITEPGAGVPLPQVVQASQVNEAVEAKLVTIQDVTIGAGNQYNEYSAVDGSGSTLIKSALLQSGVKYERITGVVTYAFGNYMIVPRTANDIAEKALSVKASPSAAELIQPNTSVVLSTPATGGEIYYTLDGGVPTAQSTKYTAPIVITADTVVKAVVVAGGETSEIATFSYKLQKTIDGAKIHEIQGASHTSPYAGQSVTNVKGILTMKRADGKWYMQAAKSDWDNNDATSEAILVEPKSGPTLAVGNAVVVSGVVKELKETGYADAKDLTTTAITEATVSIEASVAELPAPVVIGKDRKQPTAAISSAKGFEEFDPTKYAMDFFESLEGMRVTLEDARIVGPFSYETPVVLGEQAAPTVTTQAGGVILTGDGLNLQRILVAGQPAAKVKTGDKFNAPIIGVMGYDYSNYKVLPESALPAVTASVNEREKTTIKQADNKLTIASFNIENFWNNPSSAETTRKNNIAKAIVDNLGSPDIVALIEVQDDNGTTDNGVTAADQNYQALIAAITAAGGPAYSFTDIAPENNQDGGAPGGNIRVGYLYNKARGVDLTAGKTKGGATQAVAYDAATGLTLNPGRIDPTNAAFNASRKPLAAEFEFQGEKVIVIASHFNSKGGDEAPFGAVQPLPATLGSEKQRHEIAKVVGGFVDSIYEQNHDANVVVVGDLNDFQFSKTLELTKNSRLKNLVDTLPIGDRYSYVYQGNSQTLDHILVDKALAEFAEFDIVHINADFDAAQGRVSDHDPLIAQLDLAGKKAAPFELTLMHVNDTHAHLDNVANRITAIKEVRADAVNSLLFDAGDVFSGTLYFNRFLGQADLMFMNMIGFDAMTFGNHEFDNGPADLANFVKGAEFPFVSSNVDFSKEPLLKEYLAVQADNGAAEGGKIYNTIIKEVGGEKIGLFGLTTEDTKFLASPGENITFENYLEQAQAAVDELKGKGINKIVALSHIGYDFDVILANTVKEIDVIIGGHSHTKLSEPVVVKHGEVPTIIVQANEYGNFLGRVDATFDDEGVLTKWQGQLLDTTKYKQDEEAQAKLKPYSAELEQIKKQVIGKTDVTLDGARNNVRSKETNLGNLMTDGMLDKMKSFKELTDMAGIKGYVAIQNGGGIRDSIAKAAAGKTDGDITLGELLTVMPFGNNLTALRMTGQEIVEALENGVSGIETGQGRFPQVSGMRFVYDSTKKPEIQDTNGNVTQAGERIVKVEIKNANGSFSPIDLEGMYFVATNSFMAAGGDFYRSMKAAKDDGRQHELNLVDYEVFWDHLKKNYASKAVDIQTEGRITDLKGSTPPTPTPSPTTTPGSGSTPSPTTPTPTPTASPSATPAPSATPEPTATPKPTVEFNDVGSHWAAQAIEKAVGSGIVFGYADGSFRPNDTATRAEFVTMVGRALGLNATGGTLSFADAGNVPPWASRFFAKLVEDKVISGYADGTLRPHNSLTRTEMTVILVKALGIEVDRNAKPTFADASGIPAWASAYVAAAHKAGLINGVGGNLFNPQAEATRGEVVTILLAATEITKP